MNATAHLALTRERSRNGAAWRCESPISAGRTVVRSYVCVCLFARLPHTHTHIEGSSVKAIEVVRARLYTIFSRRRRSISQTKDPSNIERIFVTKRKDIQKKYTVALLHIKYALF